MMNWKACEHRIAEFPGGLATVQGNAHDDRVPSALHAPKYCDALAVGPPAEGCSIFRHRDKRTSGLMDDVMMLRKEPCPRGRGATSAGGSRI
jgi:hypothetical protein